MKSYFVIPGLDQLGGVRPQAESLQEQGIPVITIVNQDSLNDYSDCSDIAIRVKSMFDEDEITQALGPYSKNIIGYTCVQDRIWPTFFKACHRLGIIEDFVRGSVQCRIKPLMREILSGENIVKHLVVDRQELPVGKDILRKIEKEVGFPFILKPIWGQASEFVTIVSNFDEAIEKIHLLFESLKDNPQCQDFHFDGRHWDNRNQVLLEEFLPGTEYTYDGFVYQGKIHSFGLTEKTQVSVKDGIISEFGEIYPEYRLGEKEKEKVYTQINQAIKDLGIYNSPFHVEFKFYNNQCHIIEVNPRGAGWGVDGLIEKLTGIHIFKLTPLLNLGINIPSEVCFKDNSSILSFFPPATEGGKTVKCYHGLDWLSQQPELYDLQKVIKEGETVPHKNGDYYFIVAYAQGQDFARLDGLLEEFNHKFKVDFLESGQPL